MFVRCGVTRYPNGWFRLLDSHELKPGDVKHVSVAGQQLAVYRGRNSEKVYVLDAYCPHLGANLAVGGKVHGDCIECPFHQWQFNGEHKNCTLRVATFIRHDTSSSGCCMLVVLYCCSEQPCISHF